MSIARKLVILGSSLCFALFAGEAGASVYQWDYNGRSPVQNAAAGNISRLQSTYDNVSKSFSWNVTFSDGRRKDTDGYWLVVNTGPNPKSTTRELAIIYFDATTLASPNVSIYRYNGANSGSSISTPGDLLGSTRGTGASEITASASQSGDARTFNLTVDASRINSRYGPQNGFPDWKGIQFGEEIGMWFHPIAGASFHYSGQRLTQFCGKLGWLDGSHVPTTQIPAPGAAGLLAIGGLIATRRRRA